MAHSRSPKKKRKTLKAFDYKYALEQAEGYPLKVTLKKNFKGTSLFAKKPIKKGSIIAYYKFRVNKYQGYTGKKNDMYTMSIYTKKGNYNPRVIGDVFEGSLEPPKYNIPYWAYFSNEPSKEQEENCYLDVNLKFNYKNRDRVKPGETMTYKLIAYHNIKAGEEICWCYGDSYGRDYPSRCE